jgi:hypothetical protein
LIIGVLISQTLSQTRGGFGASGGFGRRGGSGSSGGVSRSTSRQETDQTKEDSLKGAVGATDEQWVSIKPKLELVRQLRRKACLAIQTSGGSAGGSQSRGGTPARPGVSGGTGAGGGFSGPMGTRRTTQNATESHSWMSWQWGRPWSAQGAQRQDELLCDELADMLENGLASPEEIERKMGQLRSARQETLKKLAMAQDDLRKVLTIDQECRLLALGWLD